MIGSDQFATISGGVVQLVTKMRPSGGENGPAFFFTCKTNTHEAVARNSTNALTLELQRSLHTIRSGLKHLSQCLKHLTKFSHTGT